MTWTVKIRPKVAKRITGLPEKVRAALRLLVADLESRGPVQGGWPNYGKLIDGRHNCHLKKSRPTDVVVWEVTDQGIKLIEVTYVGTHEGAPY